MHLRARARALAQVCSAPSAGPAECGGDERGPRECSSAPAAPGEGEDVPAVSGTEFAGGKSGHFPLMDGGDDFEGVKKAVEALLRDHARLEHMAPLAHMAWAWALPRVETKSELPASTAAAVDQCRQGNGKRLHALRANALAYWRQRKRCLAPAWERHLKTLDPHVQSVLGKGKNLLLFKARAQHSRRFVGCA